jgi:hypothetical protein
MRYLSEMYAMNEKMKIKIRDLENEFEHSGDAISLGDNNETGKVISGIFEKYSAFMVNNFYL